MKCHISPGRTTTALWRFAIGAAIVAVGVNIWSLLASHRNTEPGGCLFGDGRSYCLMATGHLAAAPFSRRILAPMMVSALAVGQLATRFAVVDLLGLVAVIVSMFVLARHLATAAGLAPRAWWAAGVIASSMFVLSPYALRGVTYAPTLVDDPAAGFGMLCLAAMVSNPRRAAHFVAPALALAAVLTRESWALPLVAAAILLTRPWRRNAPGRRLAAAIVVAAAAGVAIGLSRSYSGAGVSPIHVAAQRLAYYGHLGGLMDLVYQATLAVGVLPAVVADLWITGRRRAMQIPAAATALAGAAAVHLIQGAIEGTDVGRIAYPALPLCAVLVAIGLVATTSRRVRYFGWCSVAATAVMFHPWMTLSGSESAYPLHLYYHGGAQVLQVVATGAMALTGVGLLRARSPDNSPPIGAQLRGG